MGSTYAANLYAATLRAFFTSIESETSLQVRGGKAAAARFRQGVKDLTGAPCPASLIRAQMADRVDESSSLSSLEPMVQTLGYLPVQIQSYRAVSTRVDTCVHQES